MDATLRLLRVVWLTLLAAIIFYVALSSRIITPVPPNPLIFRAIGLVSISETVVLFILRRKLVLSTVPILSVNSEDLPALARWRAGHIVIWSLSQAIALYGLVLRYLGFSLVQVSPFFIAGFVLTLFYAPRRPPQSI